MKTTIVRHQVERGKIVVTVTRLEESRNPKPKPHSFEANLKDPVCRILGRIAKKFSKLSNSEKKGKSANEEPIELDISLKCLNGELVDPDTVNIQAWSEGAVLTIDGKQSLVTVNPPVVRSLKLPNCILIGCPVHPRVEIEEGSIEDSTFVWYRLMKGHDKVKVIQDRLLDHKRWRSRPKPVAGGQSADENGKDDDYVKKDHPNQRVKDASDSDDAPNLEEAVWTRVHQGYVCTPHDADLGHKLRVVCTPKSGNREGEPKGIMTKVEVVQAPESFPFEKRHRYTTQRAGSGQFRIVCYNILADLYADTDYSREVLYPYCSAAYLKMDYRRHLILKEILGYNADILCLQEVDKQFFHDTLESSLKRAGYQGALRTKRGHTSEGCATFHKTDTFRLIDRHDLNIVKSMTDEKCNRDLWEKVCVNDNLARVFRTRRSTMQVSVLESKKQPSQSLLVATTHFYYHPKAPYIRLLQCVACLRHIRHTMDVYANKGRNLKLVFCGDLNSIPEAGVHQLLTRGHVSQHHPDWYAGGLKDFAPNLELDQPFRLTSACGYPRYTNFVAGFCGALDYIYLDPGVISVSKIVPLPSHEDVTANTALPNQVFPSDHLALVCDVSWDLRQTNWSPLIVPIVCFIATIIAIVFQVYYHSG